MNYSVKQPFLGNHTMHDFHQSLNKEKSIIDRGEHLSVIHALNLEFEKKGLSIDFDSFEDNYKQDSLSQFRNKMGVDATFNIVKTSTREIVFENYTIDYKFRDKNAVWDDFLAEIISQDFGYYSNKIPVEGWACCNRKINDGILYILPYYNKAALIGRKELKAGFNNNRFQMTNRKYAKNRGWTTVSVPITWDRLLKVCPHTILFNYESN